MEAAAAGPTISMECAAPLPIFSSPGTLQHRVPLAQPELHVEGVDPSPLPPRCPRHLERCSTRSHSYSPNFMWKVWTPLPPPPRCPRHLGALQYRVPFVQPKLHVEALMPLDIVHQSPVVHPAHIVPGSRRGGICVTRRYRELQGVTCPSQERPVVHIALVIPACCASPSCSDP